MIYNMSIFINIMVEIATMPSCLEPKKERKIHRGLAADGTATCRAVS